MTALPKIYVFCNSCEPQWHVFSALSEDGEFLAGHCCSSHGWARHDMGVDENGWKRELYAERYPGGFDVELVEGNPRNHAGLMAAHARHVAHGPDGSPWQRERAVNIADTIQDFTRAIHVRCETCGQDLRGPYVGDVMTCGGCHGG